MLTKVLLPILIYAPSLALLEGWVLSLLWKWYALPAGAPKVPMFSFIGLCLFLAALKGTTNNAASESSLDVCLKGAVGLLFLLFVGWFVLWVFEPAGF